MVEQYIPGNTNQLIPYDIKAFCFYGVIKLILIIDKNGAKIKYEWLDENFARIDTGRFKESLFQSNFKNMTLIAYAKN
ncbi:hypothetical protein B9T31_06910 [Acinetobacter sp. ANC 4558]|uniref:hypothetical protein n=1 Tax=Acinetobacter sp. ANC 4558 TaxID=1977876 RepID=UPI000A3576B2|nr:hypothetical protein [Acinetobacter sp. ANC 4558]OTG86720.1 hypothetical protein B9T31_06910 [Acinetobacter sp. ANC 4558]